MRSVDEIHHDLDLWGFGQIGDHGAISTIIGTVEVKTVVMTWIVMILVALFTFCATRKMRVNNPSKLQVTIEELFLFIRGLVYDNIDYRKGAGLVCFVFALFTFLLFSNLWGLVPTMMSPTADLNTTFGMALVVFILVQVIGLRYKKGHYFKHYIEPVPVFLPLTIVEEFSKPITLAFRIYGNIYAGEVLIAVLLGLFSVTTALMGGFIASVVWLAFSIFVGCIQAFIFSMLTIAYTSQQISEEH